MAGYSTPNWVNDSTANPINAENLTAIGEGIELSEHPYGVCSTASASADKTVTIDYSGTLTLFDGLTIRVLFQNGNSAESPTLNVNGTGATPLRLINKTTPHFIPLLGGAIVTLTYSGSRWVASGMPTLYVSAGQKDGETLGAKATAEGENTIASGDYSHAEGTNTTATGEKAHAEGSSSVASGNVSHAQGVGTMALGYASHSQGYSTRASGEASTAEGYIAYATGDYSHAGGKQTRAENRSQNVFGEFNVADPSGASATDKGTYVEIVGNGTANNARSNARTLDWSGNETLAGKLTLGDAPTADMDAATKKYVDDADATLTSDVSDLRSAFDALGLSVVSGKLCVTYTT